ncbi:unnamed protein product [Chironomus riparius]|uniref:Transmembrane protein n=1 Tax=Chironomus riparius TaxID=315576 RepID=A0A9N9S4B4_9DIPT|nr:unnamed protein product [Chironomus riparius]
MNSINVFLLLTVAYLSFLGVASANRQYPSDILTNPKDDCGYVCGKINTETKDSNCGNADKRKESFLQVHDPNDNKEEKDEYFEAKYFECVEKCPQDYQEYESKKICVKDVEEFKKDIARTVDPIDEKLDYTWWIVGGVAGLLIVALIIAFVFIKSRSG